MIKMHVSTFMMIPDIFQRKQCCVIENSCQLLSSVQSSCQTPLDRLLPANIAGNTRTVSHYSAHRIVQNSTVAEGINCCYWGSKILWEHDISHIIPEVCGNIIDCDKITFSSFFCLIYHHLVASLWALASQLSGALSSSNRPDILPTCRQLQ